MAYDIEKLIAMQEEAAMKKQQQVAVQTHEEEPEKEKGILGKYIDWYRDTGKKGDKFVGKLAIDTLNTIGGVLQTPFTVADTARRRQLESKAQGGNFGQQILAALKGVGQGVGYSLSAGARPDRVVETGQYLENRAMEYEPTRQFVEANKQRPSYQVAKNTINMFDVTDILPAGVVMNAFKTGGDIAKFADTRKAAENALDVLRKSTAKATAKQTAETVAKTADETIQPISKVADDIVTPVAKVADEVTQPKMAEQITDSITDINKAANVPKPDDGMKTRQFIDNSVMNSKVVPDELKAQVEPIEYKPVSNMETYTKATDKVSADLTGAKNAFEDMTIFKDKDDVALAEALIADAIKKGDNDTALRTIYKSAELAGNTGSTLQAVSIFKRLDENGMLYYAGREVNKAGGKQVYDVAKKVDGTLVDDIVKNLTKAADDIPEDMAKLDLRVKQDEFIEKVQKYVAPETPKDPDELQAVNVLMETVRKRLPKDAPVPKDPMDTIVHATRNMDEYQAIWNEAKNDLLTYTDDPETIDKLIQIFDTKLRPTFTTNKARQVLKREIKNIGADIGKMVKESPEDIGKLRDQINQSLISKYGLTAEESEYITRFINNEYKDLIKVKREQELAKMFKEYGKPIQKNEIQKLVELYNVGGFQNEKFMQATAEKLGVPYLSSDDAQRIVEGMRKYKALPDGVIGTAERHAKDAALAEVMEYIANKIPKSKRDKARGILRISMLLNPKTMGRNIFGNVLLNSAEDVSQTIGAGIDTLIGSKTGMRSVATPSYGARAKGFKQGLENVIDDTRRGIDTSFSSGRWELPQGRTFENKTLNTLDKWTNTGLRAGDEPFKQAAFASRIDELKRLNKTDIITEEMINDALKTSLDRTLQDTNEYTKFLGEIRRALNRLSVKKADEAVIGLGDLVMPYVQTPANILKKTIDFSPIGLGNGIAKGVKAKLKGIENVAQQRELVETLSRGLTGTGLTFIGYQLAKNGTLTRLQKERDNVSTLKRNTGIQPFSLIGKNGKAFSIDWAQPAAMPLILGAQLYTDKGKDGERDVVGALETAGNTLFNQSVLQGLTKLLGGYSPMGGIVNSVLGSTTQITPTVGKQIAELTDPYVRDTSSDNKLVQTVNTLVSRVPLLRRTLPAKTDLFGEEIEAYQGRGVISKAYQIFLNPGYTNDTTKSALNSEILRLYESTGLTGHVPKIAPDYFSMNGTKYTLNESDRRKFQVEMGRYAKELMTKWVEDPYYEGLDDLGKQKLLENIVQLSYERAKTKYVQYKAKHGGNQ